MIHCHGPMGFVVGEAKKVLSLQMSGDHAREMPIFLIIHIFYVLPNVFHSYEERMREGLTSKQFPNLPLLDIY